MNVSETTTESKKPTAATAMDPNTITISGYALDRVYGPESAAGRDFEKEINEPGKFPFTRGIHPGMYRTRMWTMRQFAGFGSADDTNQRFKYLLEQAAHGGTNTGLSTAFDLPTLMVVTRTIRSQRARSVSAGWRFPRSTICTGCMPTFRLRK